MKSGFKSTEFYVALVGICGLTWTFLQQHCSIGPTEIYSLAGVVIVYIVQRGYLKKQHIDDKP